LATTARTGNPYRTAAGEEFIPDEELSRLLNLPPASPLGNDLQSSLVTKEGDMFVFSDEDGDLHGGHGGKGLYYKDTRFLSTFELQLAEVTPVLLSSSSERAYMAHVDLTNPDLDGGAMPIPAQSLNIRRIRVIRDRLFERIRLKNYNSHRIKVKVHVLFGADFADIFNVRGVVSERMGVAYVPRVDEQSIVFAHLGEDEVFRRTRIDLGATPSEVIVEGGLVRVTFDLDLVGHQTRLLTFVIEPIIAEAYRPEVTFDVAVHELRRSYDEWDRGCTSIYTDNELFNTWLQRGRRDLRALLTDTEDGRYIAAGIPWYVALFGRDSLITAHQILMLNPDPARDTLRLLAAHQGTERDAWRDEEPGKILHEVRHGALARAGIIPHTPYYGSIDSTPLFLILYGTYFKWTNDVALAVDLLPSVETALRWLDEHGDSDGDGFIEYEKRSSRGLDNQGWKDSRDSMINDDGSMAAPPIALAEVQGYVYLAKLRVADVFDVLGRSEQAAALRTQAAQLRERFNEAFWVPGQDYFALALDGAKRQITTVTSNPAHCLYADIVDPEKAAAMARRLLQPDMFSGWGIRTLSKSSGAYNPMSYHNGTVWPHDNALIAAGLKRYGHHKQTNRIATALFDAATYASYMRLPELFCGFTRRTPNQPVAYPVACSPQAWAAGSPFLLLQAMLGLSARAPENLLTINSPMLPPWLNTVELRNLRVGDSTLSLVFRREADTTAFSLLSKEGSVRVIMEE